MVLDELAHVFAVRLVQCFSYYSTPPCICFEWELFLGSLLGFVGGSIGGLLEQDAAQPLNELQSHLNVVLDELAHVFAVRLVHIGTS